MKLSSGRASLLVFFCITLLVMRAAGVHLHLCLDGQEAPQVWHWSDAGLHNDDEHTSGPHADFDLDLNDEALLKGAKSGFDLPFLLLAALGLFALLRMPGPLRAIETQPTFSRASRYFQPPLRAPPL
ncbi:MAG: hypothetical protein ACRETN_11020 [Nevskiales bacterium]